MPLFTGYLPIKAPKKGLFKANWGLYRAYYLTQGPRPLYQGYQPLYQVLLVKRPLRALLQGALGLFPVIFL